MAGAMDVLEANKQVVQAYIDAFNDRDVARVDALLADDFEWRTAIAGEGETELRAYQSAELQGRPAVFPLLRDKTETIEMLEPVFATDDAHRFTYRIVRMTAEDDRVAVEMEVDARSPLNERHYRNVYNNLMRVRDGRIFHYTEYQDTLHVFDVFFAQ